jgi:short-subunit dehydrogenase
MFTDKVIIITGSTQGIGLVTAEMLIHRALVWLLIQGHMKKLKRLFSTLEKLHQT